MGTFFAVLIILIVVCMGVNAIYQFFAGFASDSDKPITDDVGMHPQHTPTVSPKFDMLLLALSNEGYMGRVKSTDANLQYVDNPLLSEMITDIAKEVDMKWSLPRFRLRVRPMTIEAPLPLQQKYTHLLLTPTHAIGFTL